MARFRNILLTISFLAASAMAGMFIDIFDTALANGRSDDPSNQTIVQKAFSKQMLINVRITGCLLNPDYLTRLYPE